MIASAERALWQEVLLRAITDARLDASSWPFPVSAYAETAEARAYLATPSKDLAIVCALAGVEVEALLDRMQRQVASVAVVPVVQHLEQSKPRVPPKRNQTLTHDGKTLTVPEWVKVTGLSRAAIYGRLRRGWPVEAVLAPPVICGCA